MSKPLPPEFIPFRKIKVRFPHLVGPSDENSLAINWGEIYRLPDGEICFRPPQYVTFSRDELSAILGAMEMAAADPEFK